LKEVQKNDLKDISFESYCPFHDFSFVEQVWTVMHFAKCPHSFFLSWGWISTWLKIITSGHVKYVLLSGNAKTFRWWFCFEVCKTLGDMEL